jgi:hypothetical protein
VACGTPFGSLGTVICSKKACADETRLCSGSRRRTDTRLCKDCVAVTFALDHIWFAPASECPKVIRELKNRLLSRPLSRAASKPSFGGFIITLLFPIFTGILAYDWLPNEYYDARRHELLASHSHG